jgi:hypothetical protein
MECRLEAEGRVAGAAEAKSIERSEEKGDRKLKHDDFHT